MAESLENMEADLMATLSSALDVSKLISAFNTLFQVVKVQEKKLNEYDDLIQDLYDRVETPTQQVEAPSNKEPRIKSPIISSRQKSRLDQLETKMNQIQSSLSAESNSHSSKGEIDIDNDPSSTHQNSMKGLKSELQGNSGRSQSGKKQKRVSVLMRQTSTDDMRFEFTISRPNSPADQLNPNAKSSELNGKNFNPSDISTGSSDNDVIMNDISNISNLIPSFNDNTPNQITDTNNSANRISNDDKRLEDKSLNNTRELKDSMDDPKR